MRSGLGKPVPPEAVALSTKRIAHRTIFLDRCMHLDRYMSLIPSEHMHRSSEPRRTPRAVMTFVLAAFAGAAVLATPVLASAQATTTTAKTSTVVTKKTSAKPAAGAAAREQLPDGKQVYATTCAACHQATGEGVAGVFPPLVGSEWVPGDEGKLARIILHGITGPIEVAGETYNGMMPPWGGTMKDADIAAVITYVRSAWGNKASPITAAKVASIRAANASRTTPWTAAELAALK
jgi:mono/diheme cytochrome c family protein